MARSSVLTHIDAAHRAGSDSVDQGYLSFEPDTRVQDSGANLSRGRPFLTSTVIDMFRSRQILPVLAVLTGIYSGCGTASGPSSPEASADLFKQNLLTEVGELFRVYKSDTGKPPKSLADFARYEPGLPGGYQAIKDKEVTVLWGAGLEEGATDKVLAYEKSTPTTGGTVVMQDGVTVKKLTAEEFESAPKAPGKAEVTK